MIRCTGLAPWGFEYPFPGSLTSTFLVRELQRLVAPTLPHAGGWQTGQIKELLWQATRLHRRVLAHGQAVRVIKELSFSRDWPRSTGAGSLRAKLMRPAASAGYFVIVDVGE